MSSATDLQKILENFEVKILNNLNSVKHMLKECLPLKFMPMEFKELLAQKCWEEILFSKIVTIYMSSFLTSFFTYMPSFFMVISGKHPLLLLM
jgi:hypothetical protein